MKTKTSHTTQSRNAADTLVARVWGFCNTLRDDGVGAGEYLEQLTYLLFLKMADELGKTMPSKYNWQSLKAKSGSELSRFYTELLTELALEPGMIGQIFLQAKNAINTPATLSKIIGMIDQQTWSGLDTDLKGDLYEGILEKTAADKKSGAGQYFTARELIKVIVDCVRPKPGETICDPACGTGGFLIIAYYFLLQHYAKSMDIDEKKTLKNATFYGNEIVPTTRRLCLMNMYLHNIGSLDGEPNISLADSLIADPGTRFDLVITNPPFGKKSSQTITNDEGEEEREAVNYNRQDFWASTSNKQLNFVQHIHTILKASGRAAVVLPDNVLFEGGAGETIRRKLMETTDLHTILRLPTGIFYAQGVRANVLFFDARPAAKEAQTKEVWVYDYRTNVHHTLKQNPLKASDLADFIACYNPENRFKRKATWSEENPEGRWRVFTYDEILQREKTNLDFKWLKDDTVTPEELSLHGIQNAISDTVKQIAVAQKQLVATTPKLQEENGADDAMLEGKSLSELSALARAKILDLAIRGKLVKQDKRDGTADELVRQMREADICETRPRKPGEKVPPEHQVPGLPDLKLVSLRPKGKIEPVAEDERYFEIPKNWTWVRLSELGVFSGGHTPSLADPKFWDGGDILWVTSKDMKRKYITDTGKKVTKAGAEELGVLPIGTLLMVVRSGILRRTFPIAIAKEPLTINQDQRALQFYVPEVGEYVYAALKGLEHIVLRDYRKTGTTVESIIWEKFINMPIPLPPLAEQKRIVAKVDEMLAACDALTSEAL